MDRLFRQSGLARDKWDEVHYADGSTYGEKTLERAIARTDDVYTPPETADASPSAGDTDTALDDSSTSPTTTASDATQHTPTPSAESTSPSPAEASSSDDSTAGPHSPTATAPNSPPASHPQRAQARLERLSKS